MGEDRVADTPEQTGGEAPRRKGRTSKHAEIARLWSELVEKHVSLVDQQRSTRSTDPQRLAAYQRAYAAFEQVTGGIGLQYMPLWVPGGALDTEEPELYSYLNDFANPALSRVRRVMDAVDELNLLNSDCLRGDDQRKTVHELCWIDRDSVGLLDQDERGKLEGKPLDDAYVADELDRIEGRVPAARARIERYCRRASQFVYAAWMAVGVLVCLLLSAIMTVAAGALGNAEWIASVGAATTAGALGAAASGVGKLDKCAHIAYDAGHAAFRLFGFLRPIVGGFFGAAVYVLVAGGLFPLRTAEGVSPLLAAVALGFIAGFVEGFGVDVLGRAVPIPSRGA